MFCVQSVSAVGVVVDDNESAIQVTPDLLLAGAIAVAVVLLVAAIAGFIAYRRLKRSGRLRRLTLTAQSQLLPSGPRRDLADLSLELDGARGSARAAVAALDPSRGATGDLESLVRRLDRTAAPLAERLKQARGLSEGQLERQLPALFRQVRSVQHVADRVQTAADTMLTGEADADLADLIKDADNEIEVVAEGVRTFRQLSAGDDPLA